MDTLLQWKTNRWWYVVDRMAPLRWALVTWKVTIAVWNLSTSHTYFGKYVV